MAYNFLKHYQILPELKSKKYAPVYIFLGEENYLKNEAIGIIKKNLLKTDFSIDFNFNHLYGSSSNVDKIIEIANTLPVFSDKRLLVIDEIDKLKKLEKLSRYLENPMQSTCLVLNTTNNKIPEGLKITQKNCVIAIFYNLFENELYKWITNKVHIYGKIISANAVEKLIELCDNSLSEISQELEKLSLYIGDRKEITLDDVLKLTGDVKKFSGFALTDALAHRNFKLVLKIFRRIKRMGTDMLMVFGLINNFFHLLWQVNYYRQVNCIPKLIPDKLGITLTRYKKILPYINSFSEKELIKIIPLLADYDKKLKTTSIVPKDILLEELFCKICLNKW